MTPRVLALPGNEALAGAMARAVGADVGGAIVRAFPDSETYVRIEADVAGRTVIVVCTLDRPNEKTVPLLLLAATARDLGARRVGLVAPYLAYLRQDRRFAAGEGVTSSYFARLLSGAVDWLVTVDPHLHRHGSLAELYSIPTCVLHAAPLVATWLRTNAPDAMLVGPDVESTQWVAAIADEARLPFVVLEKTRRGDRDVEVSLPAGTAFGTRTPVLVDDIISTGRTMVAAIHQLGRLGTAAPVCIAIHAVAAEGAHEQLLAAGAAQVVTSNTIAHPSNAIDVGALLAGGVRGMLDR